MSSFAIEVRSPNAPTSRLPLAGQNLIIGRGKESQIFLDSRTISRRHAEMVLDPFGRWWIRDLGSHNGTLVNGNRVSEHLLKHGDLIQVGEFSISMNSIEESRPSMSGAPTTKAPPPQMVDAETGKITSLREFETPRLAATHTCPYSRNSGSSF